MNVFDLTAERIPVVARLMCAIKPERWEYEDTAERLKKGFHLILPGKEL